MVDATEAETLACAIDAVSICRNDLMTTIAFTSEGAATCPTDNPSDFYSDSNREARVISYVIRELSGSDLDHLIPLLQDRRERLKTILSHEEAMQAFECAPLNPRADKSPFADSIRVRVACRILISERGWRPEQIEFAMQAISFQVSCHPLIAKKAVSKGMTDGLEILKARAANG